MSIVEELLWVRGWRGQDDCKHAGCLRSGGKNVDWTFTAMGTRVYLECKFRPSDWQLLSDKDTYKGGRGYLAKAAQQFPEQSLDSSLQLVGITGVDNITHEIAHKFGEELKAYPHIDGVVYRSLAGMIHVLSQKPKLLERIMGLLVRLDVDDFPTNYVVFYLGQTRDARVALAEGSSDAQLKHSGVFIDALTPRSKKPVPIVADGTFRATIDSWGERDAEPQIKVVPSHIPVAD
jgi:hypothetical protein